MTTNERNSVTTIKPHAASPGGRAFRTLLLATALGFALTGTAGSQSFGFATFSAVVDAAGNTNSGSGIQSSKRTNTGRYVVKFTREIGTCAVVASPHGQVGGQVAVKPVGKPPKKIKVATFSKQGSLANIPFAIIVSCS